jgi:hypothetical protein
MSIAVQWFDEEKSVICWIFDPTWTWLDYAAAQRESAELMQGIDYPVYVIGDVTNSPTLPANALSAYRVAIKDTLPIVDLIVLVGSSTFVKAMVRMMMKFLPENLAGANFTFADTVEDACTTIQQYRHPHQQPCPRS